ncbi:DNA-lyase [Boeremia exigua]|uniref:DNA-lyase n=1 Tax=Boeremia exigua TaxID=749465 RepID=UPI001E8CC0CF|nr:DNA-lyase [Boeremia exigua]KAH6644048.1 DNA-lyase [Boeremia exigua]
MAKKIAEDSDSSLSPAPEEVTAPEAVKAAANGKKRKAEPIVTTTAKPTKRTKKAPAEVKEDEEVAAETPRKKRAAASKVKYEESADEDESANKTVTVVEKTVKKRAPRAKKSKEPEAPLEERTVDTKLRIGAHVSVAGGVHNAINNVLHIGANAFAMFMKNQRKWENPDMDPAHATLFIDGCKAHNIDVAHSCLPHGSYLVNLAHPDAERKKQAYDCFQNDLVRCHTLGIKLYNFHPGNANATTREEGIRLIAANLNQAHADPATGAVITVLETMASQGNTIGGTFEDLAAIIALVHDKSRVGVCLDTCHVFAAGYDLRSPASYAAVLQQFDDTIGLHYLRALHVNDSKAPLASYRDLHARLGTGYLGLRAFHNLVNDARMHGLPMVLETPAERVDASGKKVEDKGVWAREIKMLERLVGMDVESEEFLELEKGLFEEGVGERERVGGQVERKKEKDAKPKAVRKKKEDVELKTEDVDAEEDVKPKRAAPKRKAAAKKKVESEEEDDEE